MEAGSNVNARETGLVCRHSLQQTLRSGAGLVFILLALFFGLMVAYLIISPFEMFVAQSERVGFGLGQAEVEQQVIQLVRPVVEWALSSRPPDDPEARREAEQKTEEWVTFVLDERPALLSAILFIMLFGMPLLIPFGAFNQTAGDIGKRRLRFLLLRTGRGNIYYGRLLATVLLTVAVQIFVVVTVSLYLGLKVHLYEGTAILSWSLQGLLALVAVSLPYVAICSWFSAGSDSPSTSLVICNLVIGGVPLAAFLLGLKWEAGQAIDYLLPWGIQKRLLAPDVPAVAMAVSGCLLYAVAFAWLGARKFQTRDL